MKKAWINIVLVFVFLVGLSLLLYPTVSSYINSLHQSRAISVYNDEVANANDEIYEQMFSDARAYNAERAAKDSFTLSEEEEARYRSLLSIGASGVIGYIEIPKINCYLPIYHGTSDSALQNGVGHLEWSSLPVGGEGSHCVLSGHRALPNARLFTDLDQLEQGDIFTLEILNETLAYEVTQIRIVEPHEVGSLAIQEGEDLCTLVTCTPYGINSHRLLITGKRTENITKPGSIRVTADAIQIDKLIVAPVVAIPILLVLLFFLLITTSKKRDRK